MRLPMSSRSSH